MPMRWTASELTAGGFHNVGARRGNVIVAGGDVNGFTRSDDGGLTWRMWNDGIRDPGPLHVASIVAGNAATDTWYAATGDAVAGGGGTVGSATQGGFFRRRAGGAWEELSTVPQFAGNNPQLSVIPTEHPRSTGTLIALSDLAENPAYIWVATYAQGVMRSTDGGVTWGNTWLLSTSKYLRGLAYSGDVTNKLYVCAYPESGTGGGVSVCTDPKVAGTGALVFNPMDGTNAPTYCEELHILDGTLYAACDHMGARKIQVSAGRSTAWTLINTGLTITANPPHTHKDAGPFYLSLTGYKRGSDGAHVLFMGCFKAAGAGQTRSSIMRTADGGGTWASITSNTSLISTGYADETEKQWWLAEPEPQIRPGGSTYVAAQIVLEDADPPTWMVSIGRSGCWRGKATSTTPDLSVDAPQWNPAVRGASGTIVRELEVDPGNAAYVHQVDADRLFVRSFDRMENPVLDKPNSATAGYCLDITATGRVYVGVGSQASNTSGSLHSKGLRPSVEATWFNESLPGAGKRPLGVVVRTIADGTPAILVAVEGSGVWRKVGDVTTGTWVQVNAAGMFTAASQGSKTAVWAWQAGSPWVFLFERSVGIWRSSDYGAAGSWNKIWSIGSNREFDDWIAVDPTNESVLWVSKVSSLHKLTGVNSPVASASVEGGQITDNAVPTSAVPNPGPVRCNAAGKPYVACRASSVTNAKLMHLTGTDATLASAWTDQADSLYVEHMGFPYDIAVASDEKVYVGGQGLGIIVGETDAPVVTATQWKSSGLVAGGFHNCGGRRGNVVIAGGDVNGFSRSDDGGLTWKMWNLGLREAGPLHVASIVPGQASSDTWYAGTGDCVVTGGVGSAVDGGFFRRRSTTVWEKLSAVPQFGGNNTKLATIGGEKGHPRSTGRLIALSDTATNPSFIWVATYADGVMRSTDGGVTWPTADTWLNSTAKYLRGLVYDDVNDDLYVCAYPEGGTGGGVWKCATPKAAGAMSFTKMTGTNAPAYCEFLEIIDGVLYAACDHLGARKMTMVDGVTGTWTLINTGLDVTTTPPHTNDDAGPFYCSLAGYKRASDGAHVLFMGNSKPPGTGSQGKRSIMRTVDGGANWASISSNTTLISNAYADDPSTNYWLAVDEDRVRVGGGTYVGRQLLLEAADPPTNLVAIGREGAWRAKSTDLSTVEPQWNPAVRGMTGVIVRELEADPGNPAYVHQADADRLIVRSFNRMTTPILDRPDAANAGYCLDIASDGRLYAGTGNQTQTSNTDGALRSKGQRPTVDTSWTDELLPGAGKKPLGVVVRTAPVGGPPAVDTRRVLAAIHEHGVWSKTGSDAWVQVNATGMFTTTQGSKTAVFAWHPGSKWVFLFDRNSGIWRSSDYGALNSWNKIWAIGSNRDTDDWIAIDPTNESVLWVSKVASLHKLTGVNHTSATATVEGGQIIDNPVPTSSVPNPGPVRCNLAGEPYVACRVSSTNDAKLMHLTNGEWVDKADDLYRNQMGYPYDITVASDGVVYVGGQGLGIIVGETVTASVSIGRPQQMVL